MWRKKTALKEINVYIMQHLEADEVLQPRAPAGQNELRIQIQKHSSRLSAAARFLLHAQIL